MAHKTLFWSFSKMPLNEKGKKIAFKLATKNCFGILA
jgi:hypothetical protein